MFICFLLASGLLSLSNLDLEFLQPVYLMDGKLICKAIQTITNQSVHHIREQKCAT